MINGQQGMALFTFLFVALLLCIYVNDGWHKSFGLITLSWIIILAFFSGALLVVFLWMVMLG